MKNFYVVIALAVLAAVSVAFFLNKPEGPMFGGVNYSETKTLLNAVSATTTSSAIDVVGAKRVTLSLNVANVTDTGLATTTFAVTGSVDGTNYVTVNKLIDNVTNTNAQGLTRVASKVLDTNSTSVLSVDLEHDTYKFLKVSGTIIGTTTAAVTATALIDY